MNEEVEFLFTGYEIEERLVAMFVRDDGDTSKDVTKIFRAVNVLADLERLVSPILGLLIRGWDSVGDDDVQVFQ